MKTATSKLIALVICPEATKKSTCMEPNVLIMPSLNLCEESKAYAEKQIGPTEDAVATRSLKFNNEPLEMSAHSMPSSDNGKKRKISIERQTEVDKFAVVSSEDNIVKHSMPSSDNSKERKFSTERKTEIEEHAVVSPEDNMINLEEESCDDTTLESQPLGLKARIWRMEKIFDVIKAAKGSISIGYPEK